MDMNQFMQSLHDQVTEFDMSSFCENLDEQDLAYLQVLPPSWITEEHPLHKQMQALAHLYCKGKIVWGAIVQANRLLFEKEPYSCPAEIVYDPSGQISTSELENIAEKLFMLKNVDINSLSDPEEVAYASSLQAEHTHFYKAIPHSISTEPLLSSSIFIWRMHLPAGEIRSRLLPILVSNECKGVVTMLPSRFWKDSFLYKNWVGSSQLELDSAFYDLNKERHFWQCVEHKMFPKKQDFLVPKAHKPTFMNDSYEEQEANEESKEFIQNCVNYCLEEFDLALANETKSKKSILKIAIWGTIAVLLLISLIW